MGHNRAGVKLRAKIKRRKKNDVKREQKQTCEKKEG